MSCWINVLPDGFATGPLLPAWIEVRPTPAFDPGLALEPPLGRLDAGERAAIRLAESLRADLILLDERAGRRVAAERGLRVTGLLGVLDLAADLGLVELGQVLDELRATGFRASQELMKRIGRRTRD